MPGAELPVSSPRKGGLCTAQLFPARGRSKRVIGNTANSQAWVRAAPTIVMCRRRFSSPEPGATRGN